MNAGLTAEDLIAFERDVAETFNRGEIRSPVHLAGGNERQLIHIFERIREQDWVAGTWRAHYHCLLKGVPPDELKAAIVAGRSIALCFPKHRVVCSAMVGGIAPVALGLAWAAKRRRLDERVYCFLGDMALSTGIVSECHRYSRGFDLPVTWIVEDNGRSVATDTAGAWGQQHTPRLPGTLHYHYALPHGHVGTGKFVRFV